ncbi:MAG: DNA-binding protein [Proteobacteria bacterium]|nr:DNA-binding protein [Pseudomonadota bacterium]
MNQPPPPTAARPARIKGRMSRARPSKGSPSLVAPEQSAPSAAANRPRLVVVTDQPVQAATPRPPGVLKVVESPVSADVTKPLPRPIIAERPVSAVTSAANLLSSVTAKPLPVRLGFRMVKGLSAADADEIIARRGDGYRSIEDLWHRTRLSITALERLAQADAFQCLGVDRRSALWAIRGLSASRLPLIDHVAAERDPEPTVPLDPMTAGRQVVEDYRAVGLSLRQHPVSFLRTDLASRRIVRCSDLATLRDGRRVEVAGIVLVRQRPGSARGVLFVTIEDETGHANLILWPAVFEAQRRLVLSASMVACRGKLQREGEVIHVIAEHLTDLSALLRSVGARDEAFPVQHARADETKHGTIPDSRSLMTSDMRDINMRGRRPPEIKVPTRNFR